MKPRRLDPQDPRRPFADALGQLLAEVIWFQTGPDEAQNDHARTLRDGDGPGVDCEDSCRDITTDASASNLLES